MEGVSMIIVIIVVASQPQNPFEMPPPERVSNKPS
jgi:hypothetical protein